MRIHHDGAAKVYLNGTLIYDKEKGDYVPVDLRNKQSLLKEGNNLLAIEGHKGRRSNFLDIALFDMKDQVADDILYTPGQPNLLRGPNGFEWWLIYMANKNGEPRGQYINRVHFFDRKLTVDGITGKNTPGFHPLPAKPDYQYLSENNQTLPPVNKTIPSIPATNYFFEAGVKLSGANTPACGIIAWEADKDNRLKIGINCSAKTWFYVLQEKGRQQTLSFPLAADFRTDVFHTLSVYKNDRNFDVKIDNLPAPVNSLIRTNFSGKGLPGIYSGRSDTAFDGITYTIGWDDDNANNYTRSSELLLKGDLLDNYEMSVQINAGLQKGIAGAYPVYIDQNNYLKTAFDFSNQQWTVSGKNKGKAIETRSFSLAGLKPQYANMVFSDFMERHFVFETPTTLDAILFQKKAIYRSDTLIENIHEKFQIYYIKEGRWVELNNFQPVDWDHPGMSKIKFPPIETTELIFVNKIAENENFVMRDFSLQKIWIHEIFKQSYNLRVEKMNEKILFFIDGELLYQIPNEFASSRIGLFSEGLKADFKGITVFHLPDY